MGALLSRWQTLIISELDGDLDLVGELRLSSKFEGKMRQQIVDCCRWMSLQGLVAGTSGNVSVRLNRSAAADSSLAGTPVPANSEDLQSELAILISPSGVPYDSMKPDMIARLDGEGVWQGSHLPSSEWRIHVDILKACREVHAVVHTHSDFATTLSIGREEIPACHYLIVQFGGHNIRCAPYARFGTQELSDYAVTALEGRWACLLSNHGAIALGRTLQHAVNNAMQLEALAKHYYFARLLGSLTLLSESQIEETRQGIEELNHQLNSRHEG
jgi:L-fuculose-phosphate aldolase